MGQGIDPPASTAGRFSGCPVGAVDGCPRHSRPDAGSASPLRGHARQGTATFKPGLPWPGRHSPFGSGRPLASAGGQSWIVASMVSRRAGRISDLEGRAIPRSYFRAASGPPQDSRYAPSGVRHDAMERASRSAMAGTRRESAPHRVRLSHIESYGFLAAFCGREPQGPQGPYVSYNSYDPYDLNDLRRLAMTSRGYRWRLRGMPLPIVTYPYLHLHASGAAAGQSGAVRRSPLFAFLRRTIGQTMESSSFWRVSHYGMPSLDILHP